ncbi:MAG: substrate-binding domain-containing protein [Victivallaceae bacterium]
MKSYVIIFAVSIFICAAASQGKDIAMGPTKKADAYNKIDAGLVVANAAGESDIIQDVAMAAAQADPDLAVTVETLSREAAINKFASGKAGLLLLRSEPSPAEQKLLQDTIIAPYAAEPTIIVVHFANTISDIKIEMARKIFSGEVASWRPLGINDYMIHLFGLDKNLPGTGPMNDKILGSSKLTSRIFTVSSSPEVLELVTANNNAMGFCAFVESPPETVKLLTVDGFLPNETNILTGKYPLVNVYYACFKKGAGNELARKFAETLRSPAMTKLLKDRGLISKIN